MKECTDSGPIGGYGSSLGSLESRRYLVRYETRYRDTLRLFPLQGDNLDKSQEMKENRNEVWSTIIKGIGVYSLNFVRLAMIS